MRCPDCGAEMNRHAEKPIKAAGHEEDEVIATIHQCRACGKTEAEVTS